MNLRDLQTCLAARGVPPRRHAWSLGESKLAYADESARVSPTGDGLLDVDETTMSVGFVITSLCRDRQGDVVVPQGCEKTLAQYAANPQVFFSHRSQDLPVALARTPEGRLAVWPERDRVLSRAYFHGKTRESDDVFRLVACGVLRASSIGFLPLVVEYIPPPEDSVFAADGLETEKAYSFDSGGFVFHEWTLMEWSVVPIPANPEALRSAIDRGISDRLKKSLEPFAAKTRVTLFLDRPAAKDCGVGGDRPRRPQAVLFRPDRFDEADCREWLAANALQAAELARGGKDDDPWVAELFAAGLCEPDTALRKEVEDGVEIVFCICPQKDAEEAPRGDEPHLTLPADMSTPSNETPAPEPRDAGPALTKADAPAAAPTPAAGPAPEAEEAPRRPLGAELLAGLHGRLKEAADFAAAAMAELDNPRVKGYVARFLRRLADASGRLEGFAKSAYPEVFGEPEAAAAGDAAPAKAMPGVKAKGMARKDLGVVSDAAEFLGELAGEGGLRRSQKSACKLHAAELRGLAERHAPEADADAGLKAAAPPARKSDAAAPADATTADSPAAQEIDPQVIAQVEQLSQMLYALTGKEV